MIFYRDALANKRDGVAEGFLREKARNNPEKPKAALQLVAHFAPDAKTEAVQSMLQGILDACQRLPMADLMSGGLVLRKQHPTLTTKCNGRPNSLKARCKLV